MRAILAVGVILAVGCGGGPTTPPSPSPSPAIAVFDGWTGQAVGAMEMSLPGAPFTIIGPDRYLVRVQPAAPQVWLWPATEPYVRALVYTDFVPGRRLSRWLAPFAVRPLPGPDGAWATAQAAAATELPLTVGDGAVAVVVDPATVDEVSRAALAVAVRAFRGNEIVGCTVAVRDARRLSRGALLHELGHCLGLGHSETPGDLMYFREQIGVETFSAAELVALRLMYRYRAPGNAAPDRAPEVLAAGGPLRVIPVID